MNEDKSSRVIAEELKQEAVEVAKTLVAHAQETARQMILLTNLDTSKIPLICHKINDINEHLASIDKHLETRFVTQESFGPVQKIVYGMVGLILLGVGGALLTLVVNQ